MFLYFRSYITQPGNVIRIYVPSTIFFCFFFVFFLFIVINSKTHKHLMFSLTLKRCGSHRSFCCFFFRSQLCLRHEKPREGRVGFLVLLFNDFLSSLLIFSTTTTSYNKPRTVESQTLSREEGDNNINDTRMREKRR